MASPQGTVSFYVQSYLAGNAIAVGDALLPVTGTDGWVTATALARGTARASGIAVSVVAGSGFGTVEIWMTGSVDPSVTGLGPGSQSWVRTSTTGRPERFTPTAGGTSDIIGACEADGRLHMLMGIFTESMAAALGTPPGGVDYATQIGVAGTFAGVSPGTSGQVLTSNGPSAAPTYQAAAAGGATAVGNTGNLQAKAAGNTLSAISAGAGNIGKALVALTADTFGAGAIGLATSAVNGVLGLANGGTGLSTAGSDGQLLGTNGTAASWTNRLGRLLLGASGASYPGSGFISLAYNSGVAQSIINGFDSTATIRDYLLHGPGDALTWGNGALDTIFKAGNSYLMTIGITGAIEATATAWGFALPVGGSSGYTKPFGFRSLVKDISAGGTITLTAAEAACPWIDFTGSPAATVDVVFPAGPSMYFLKNSASQAINIRKSGGSNLAMGSTGVRLVGCRDASSQYEFRSA